MPRLRKYEKLYIYTLHGAATGARARFGDSLLAEWEDAGTTLLFFEAPREEDVRRLADELPGLEYLSETVLDYENWEAGQPVAATRVAGFLVCPTWDILEPSEDEPRILLDPGVAFGTGLHPTTRSCLRALREVFTLDRPARVLDLGCGTGILSIAALLLGAESAVAVDYTSMATDTARACFDLNGLSARSRIILGGAAENLHHEAGLIISNIYIQVIEKLFRRHEYTERKWLLVSGIHGSEQAGIAAGLIKNSGRKIIETYEENNWYTYLTGLNP